MLRKTCSSILLGAATLAAAHVAYGQGAGAQPIPSIDALRGYHQCHEYLPPHYPDACRIDFDMTQTIDAKLPPQTHKDITVHLGTDERGIITLWRSSPFTACSVTTTPGPLTRDMSPNVPGLFTTIGGFGASLGAIPGNVTELDLTSLTSVEKQQVVVQGDSPSQMQIDAEHYSLTDQYQISPEWNRPLASPKAQKEQAARKDAEIQKRLDVYIKAEEEMSAEEKKKDIKGQEAAIETAFTAFNSVLRAYNELYSNIEPDTEDLGTILKFERYSYRNDLDARRALDAVQAAAKSIVSRPLPDPNKSLPDMRSKLEAIRDLLTALGKAYGDVKQVKTFIDTANQRFDEAWGKYRDLTSPDRVALAIYISDSVTRTQKLLDYVNDWKQKDALQTLRSGYAADASVQILPIALYPESKVAVTVKCVDAVASNQIFDSIQFNAYFQEPPKVDISAGLLISTMPNRTYAAVAPYSAPPSSTPTNPTSCTTNSPQYCAKIVQTISPVQFMPGLFFEYHPWNFKLPGVKDPADVPGVPPDTIPTWMSVASPRHPLGYVGSFGPAFGAMANPNGGSTQAEFFAGVSIGFHRFAFLAGDHIGRPLELNDGYLVNQLVAPGTALPTKNGWGNGLAFGITYRLPLR